ncbi:MAG: hypothetical protein H7A51_06095 [Akkermansiaceae bacterium]|nr:hypothetical protein [Akkermansiaceae bacterium]
MGLEQDGVDVLDVDGFGLVAHGLDQGADAEVFDRPECAFRTACDEVGGGFCEGGVRESCAVKLAVDVFGEVCGGELLKVGGVGDAALDVMVDSELECGVEGGLADEDEVVILALPSTVLHQRCHRLGDTAAVCFKYVRKSAY